MKALILALIQFIPSCLVLVQKRIKFHCQKTPDNGLVSNYFTSFSSCLQQTQSTDIKQIALLSKLSMLRLSMAVRNAVPCWSFVDELFVENVQFLQSILH